MGRKGDLGKTGVRIINISPDPDNLLPAFWLFFADNRGNGHFVIVINSGKGHGHLMGRRLEAVEKPGEDILFRKVINQILNSPFIRGLDRTEEYGCSFLISPV